MRSPLPYKLEPRKMPTLWVLRPARADLVPYVGGSMKQVSPIHHPSFSAKAPRLRKLEVPDHYISL